MKRVLPVCILACLLVPSRSDAWVTEALDWAAFCGQGRSRNTAVAVDTSGTAHVSSYNESLQALQVSTNATGQWATSILDSSVRVGEYSAVAADASGGYHIAYYRYRDGLPGNWELRYASNAHSAWTFEAIDSPGLAASDPSMAVDGAGHAHVTYAFLDGAQRRIRYANNVSGSWVSVPLDPSTDGMASSLALDGSGNAHILFSGYRTCGIWYATNRSGAWETFLLDPTAQFPYGTPVSITVDPLDQAHACYFHPDTDCLKYATNPGGVWQSETFLCSITEQSVGIGVDASGNVHVCCVKQGDVWEARRVAGAWGFLSMGSSGGGRPSLAVSPGDGTVNIAYDIYPSGGIHHARSTGGAWTAACIPTVAAVGGRTAMATDTSGHLFILYDRLEIIHDFLGDTARMSLGRAHNLEGSWSSTVLVTAPDNLIPVPGIDDRSIAVDASGVRHVIYSLWYPDGIPGTWELHKYPGATIDGTAGRFNSAATDSAGHVHVSYAGGGLRYATDASGSWAVETIGVAGPSVGSTSIAVDASDRVHIAYESGSGDDLAYASNVSGAWVSEAVDTEADLVGYVSLALDSDGHAHVAYLDGATGAVKHAAGTGGGPWTIETADMVAPAGLDAQPSIAVGPADTVHIGYPDESTRTLKYATRRGDAWATEIACDRFFGSGKAPSLVVLDSGAVHISHSGYDGTLLLSSGTPCMDGDGDGYGTPGNPACPNPEPDCDDKAPGVNPGAGEACANGIDDDCDGLADGADPDCGAPPAWGLAGQVAASAHGSRFQGVSGKLNALAVVLLPLGAASFLRMRSPGSRKNEARW